MTATGWVAAGYVVAGLLMAAWMWNDVTDPDADIPPVPPSIFRGIVVGLAVVVTAVWPVFLAYITVRWARRLRGGPK